MFNKDSRNRKKDITDKVFQKEVRNYSGLKCEGNCLFTDLIDKTIRVMVKVKKTGYKNPQDLLLPTMAEHLENNETSYQQLVRSRFQSMELSCNIPTSDILEDYGIHITNNPGFGYL